MIKLKNLVFIVGLLWGLKSESKISYLEWNLGILKSNWAQNTFNLESLEAQPAIGIGAMIFLSSSDEGVYPGHHFGFGLQQVSFDFSNETIRLLNLRLAYRYELQKWFFGLALSPLNEFDISGDADFKSVQLAFKTSRIIRFSQFFHVSLGPSLDWYLPEPNEFSKPNYSFEVQFRFIPHSNAASQSKFLKRSIYR